MLLRYLTVLLFLYGNCFAQNTALRAGHLVDPETGRVLTNQVIIVRDGKIVEVGKDIDIPKGMPLVDLSDSWVLPGLIDVHTHVTMNLPPTPPGESFWENYLLKESTALRALRGVRNGRVLLEAGFTTIRDIGNEANYADTAVRQALEKGWFVGPTIFNAGKIIAPFGGQSYAISPESGRFWQNEYIDADSPEEVRKAVRQNIYYGATAIKMVADNSRFYYDQDEIRSAVAEAHKAGITVGVHVNGGEAARNVILGGADSIEHGFDLSDELLELMKEKGTVLVGTDFPYEHLVALGGILPLDPKVTSERIIDRLKRAHRIGVKLAFGSDTVADLPGRNRAEMAIEYFDVWQSAGIPPADILRALTTNAADLLRIGQSRGRVAPGFAADIIATAENPLDDIRALRKVRFVMKDGRIVKQLEQGVRSD